MPGGVVPAGDGSLPTGEKQQQPLQSNSTSRKSFLTFRQLNSLAIMIIFVLTGMVSLQHLFIFLFSFIYVFFLSKVSFPTLSLPPVTSVFDSKSRKLLRLYILIAAIIGLFLPILYIFHGIFNGDKEGIKAAVPQVFLLSSQGFMEGVSASDRFSLPIRVFVPVFYNSVRIIAIVEWVRYEMVKGGDDGMRLYVGRGLAVANLGLWCFNLFGFLLPVYLPKAFKIYYTGIASIKKG